MIELPGLVIPVRATDYTVSPLPAVSADFIDQFSSPPGTNDGTVSSETKISQDNAYQSGGMVYGPNNPVIYSGLVAEFNSAPPAGYTMDNVMVTIAISDSAGASLDPHQIGDRDMLVSPADPSTGTDYGKIFYDISSFILALKGIPVPPNIQYGASATTGIGSDTTSLWAKWVNCVCANWHVTSKGVNLRYQPNFPRPDVYTITVRTQAEMWGAAVEGWVKVYTATSSYSFNYVYENDAGVAGDAGGDFSTARGISLGSYSGLLYGADTVDMYKFDVTIGQTIYYNVIPPISANFPVAIYYPNWTYAAGSNLGTGAVNYGSFTATTTGSWFMKVYLVSGSGTYSFTLANMPLPRDFTIDANPTSLCIPAGFSSGSVITLRSLQGYSGSVSVSSSLAPSTSYVSTFVTASPLTLASSTYAQTNAQVQASSSDFSQGSYTVHVTANSGSLSHSLDVAVTVSNTQCPSPSGGGGGGGSVAAGTLITLADGSAVPVQLIRVGSVVRTYDVFSHTAGTAMVTSIRTVVVDNQLEIYTASGLPFRTDDNPLFRLHVMRDGLVALMPVTEIQPGDLLFSYNDMTWVPVERVRVSFGGQHTVYDLTTSPIADFIANGYADCVKACRV